MIFEWFGSGQSWLAGRLFDVSSRLEVRLACREVHYYWHYWRWAGGVVSRRALGEQLSWLHCVVWWPVMNSSHGRIVWYDMFTIVCCILGDLSVVCSTCVHSELLFRYYICFGIIFVQHMYICQSATNSIKLLLNFAVFTNVNKLHLFLIASYLCCWESLL